ncbi:flagellin [Pseudodesulfovibrio cashew]|uniref:Flagellin n=1 Tax=Pseudodesulfovibrio cashew TaxID=2678688 RepID=A0A6I6JIC7_9BACT|nr:flagellin [Pseudodesulfovibrio cashew]QGY39927.1 flagellin [Pseudodesulfovibrio cashew]
MALAINHNLMAMNASRNLGATFGDLATSTRRLSSGLRISQASDDAAGLAIRELMRAEIASLNQGIRNANDAISLVQTADGALGVIDEKLIRMKELAMQAATGTYNSDQRLIIDSEYQAMASEITRIAQSTDFNGIHLLNGNLSGAHNGTGLQASGRLKVHFGTGNDCAEDYYYIQINTATASALGVGGGTRRIDNLDQAGILAANAGATFIATGTWQVGLPLYNNTPDPPRSEFASGSQAQLYTYNGNVYAVMTDTTGSQRALRYSGVTYQGEGGLTVTEVTTPPGSHVDTQERAQEALDPLNRAIISKDTIRANLGALQNRLENTVTALEIQAENLQAAESRISDVDVATEMTEFVRNQIKAQAAVSMLSQANSLPRMALSLIG